MTNPANTAPHGFRRLYCSTCGHALDVPISCGDRFCASCAPARAARIRRRLSYLLHNFAPPPGQFFAMITLSIQNHEKLDQQCQRLVAAFRRLRQRRSWKRHVSGGATIIEIKKNESGWHAHLHVLCYMSWFDWHYLHFEWTLISGGIGVYITRPSHDKALGYVTKYVTKSDLDDSAKQEASKALRKYRLFQRFGLWQGYKIPKLKSDFPCPQCHRVEWIYIHNTEYYQRRYG